MGATEVVSASNESRQLAERDVLALRRLISDGYFDCRTQSIGFEMEGSCTDRAGRPDFGTYARIEALDGTNTFQFQGEVGAHNFEVNGAAIPLDSENPFGRMLDIQEQALRHMQRNGFNPVLSGVFLPLTMDDLGESEAGFNEEQFNRALNPGRPRYQDIYSCWQREIGPCKEMRFDGHGDFLFHSFLLEMAMTSVHTHLQLSPDQVPAALNISSILSAPLLALFASSPRFLGRLGTKEDYRSDIWRETFSGRTGVGPKWFESLDDYFNTLLSYPMWLDAEGAEDPLDVLDRGGIPTLAHFPILQGTLWWDSRPKFFPGVITIEERTMGSSSPFDHTAKAALWVGLMRYYLEHQSDVHRTFGNFSDAEKNSEIVSQTGLRAKIYWFGRSRPVRSILLEELIPKAVRGLRDITSSDLRTFFDYLTEMTMTGRTQSAWIRRQSVSLAAAGLSTQEIDLAITCAMQRDMFDPMARRKDL